jgi:hypothetical protein
MTTKHVLKFPEDVDRVEVAALELLVVYLGGGRKRSFEDGQRVEHNFGDFELTFRGGPKTTVKLSINEMHEIALQNETGDQDKKIYVMATSLTYQPSTATVKIFESKPAEHEY